MFRNYFLIALRNLWKHRVFSGINLLGLAVGMSSFLLIFSYVSFEWSYDRYHVKADRIYRVITDMKSPTETIHTGTSSSPTGPQLKADFPEVEAQTRIGFTAGLLQNGDRQFQENNILTADSTVFSVFTFPLLEGDAATALKEPRSIVLSEAAARKYFGSTAVLGRTLTMDGSSMVRVTGVMKNIPANSHFRTDIFLSLSTELPDVGVLPSSDRHWANTGWFTYVLLSKGADVRRLQARLPEFTQRYEAAVTKATHTTYTLWLQPLADIHLGPQLNNYGEGEPTGSKVNTYIFSVIAGIILLIACINFVNLTTARASERAREVGIRKTMGALRGQLTVQFLGESILLCLFAFGLAVGLCNVLQPLFTQMLGKNVPLTVAGHGSYIWTLLGVTVAIGVLAGIYPALILSGFKPIAVLKGRLVAGKNGLSLRQGLVVFQFTISIALIVGTIVVYDQLRFMQDQDLGFNKNQMLVINYYGDSVIQQQSEHIRQELEAVPNVKGVSFSNNIPGGSPGNWFVRFKNPAGEVQGANVNGYMIDFDFLRQYDIKLLSGRGFSKAFSTDSTDALVINEAAARSIGYTSPEAAIGNWFSFSKREGRIIGVVKDFHYQSLQEEIQPLFFKIRGASSYQVASLQLTGGQIQETVAALEKKWKSLNVVHPFEYSFADEDFSRLYNSQDRFGRVFLYFSLLAIFISCLGLLGLAAYSTVQRIKEIGIRKILGASVPAIVGLLSRDFLRLVVFALVIASPIAWLIMHRWLQDFAYRTTVSWWVFLVAGCAAVLIAFLTVGFHSIRAAVSNPVDSLRAE